jgi:hypothetical protein
MGKSTLDTSPVKPEIFGMGYDALFQILGISDYYANNCHNIHNTVMERTHISSYSK